MHDLPKLNHPGRLVANKGFQKSQLQSLYGGL